MFLRSTEVCFIGISITILLSAHDLTNIGGCVYDKLPIYKNSKMGLYIFSRFEKNTLC